MPKIGGKDVILEYLKQHLGNWVHNQELRDASGLNDTPRTIRALRQEGWQIEVRGDGFVRMASLERRMPRGERQAITAKMRYEVLHRDNYRCKTCGRGPNNGVKLEVDHVIPVDWSGKTELSNLQTLCRECNAGKKAWIGGKPSDKMAKILSKPSVEARIEALFDFFPDEDIPSTMIQFVSRGSLDWQRALRRIRQRTGKRILPTLNKTAYRYYKGR